MATAISNKALFNKAKRFIMEDTSRGDKTFLLKDALITASREIAMLGGSRPLAWNREIYDELFTRYYATISAITQASTGVITADSVDPSLSDDHGFQTDDIVYLTGINGTDALHELNARLFRAVRASATTITLKTLDGQTAINTTNYEEYDSGGTIYHAGLVLPKSSIEPSSGTASYVWTIKRVYDVLFDLQPGCVPITEEAAKVGGWMTAGSSPKKWRYQQYTYSTFAAASVDHVLFWYHYPSQKYNIRVLLEKTYPDLSVWTSAVYPPHPAEMHDYIWHRALSNLATHAEKQRRRTAGLKGEQGDNTKMEILNANYWIAKAASEEVKILDYNRLLSGQQSYMSDAMEA